MSNSPNRFANLGFEDFRRLAKDETLSKYERIGFPDAYRSGKEECIFQDILSKLTLLEEEGKTVLDIGPGCSDLPRMLVNHCESRRHSLILVDAPEMLDQLPAGPGIEQIAAFYPDCPQLIKERAGAVNVILCYSVLHYIFVETSIFRFLDTSLSLLAPGGQMLIGDIPNISKRKRFFASDTGIKFHQEFMHTTDIPEVRFNQIEQAQIDDAVVMSIIQRTRQQGFDAYVLPQNPHLPMSNRREDILIVRP
ncbi:MAG: class I SAM-dependent methyltransferase [Gallionella sp.]|jgi:cyclopropane fatty-acyl-phospholipid synthase-like methyltransferase|nr:class I SAM-dependent methyltransferase [Gallionella sp.]